MYFCGLFYVFFYAYCMNLSAQKRIIIIAAEEAAAKAKRGREEAGWSGGRPWSLPSRSRPPLLSSEVRELSHKYHIGTPLIRECFWNKYNIQPKKERQGFAFLYLKCTVTNRYRTFNFQSNLSRYSHTCWCMHSQIKITGGFSIVPQPLAFARTQLTRLFPMCPPWTKYL